MPAHHLTATQSLATSVTRVLAGAPLDDIAVAAGLDRADLADAVATYHAAGLAALDQHTNERWYQVRVTFPIWEAAEDIATAQLGPALDHLVDTGATRGWWFLRKHPCWRLRFDRPDTTALHEVLDELTGAGVLSRWWPSVYEPETTAFGGPTGLRTAHELFCADSHGVLHHLRQPIPGLGRRELSLLLLGALLDGAGVDWFERGDVFARVAQLRPTPTIEHTRIDGLTDNVRGLLGLPTDAHNDLFAPGGPAALASPWRTAYIAAGQQLADAATQGTLHRGLRAVTTHIIIFHWNRLGLPASAQGILARAGTEAFLPRS